METYSLWKSAQHLGGFNNFLSALKAVHPSTFSCGSEAASTAEEKKCIDCSACLDMQGFMGWCEMGWGCWRMPWEGFWTVSQSCPVTQQVSDSWRCGQEGRWGSDPGCPEPESPADNPHRGVPQGSVWGPTVGIAFIMQDMREQSALPAELWVSTTTTTNWGASVDMWGTGLLFWGTGHTADMA